MSFWGESYAGHYVPTYSDYFEKQNDLIASGAVKSSAIPLHIDTVGLVNACIDIDTQMPSYPEFAFNNTYGIKAINETQYRSAIESAPACRNLTATCRRVADQQDPQGLGNNQAVNKACLDAFLFCFSKMHDIYDPSVRVTSLVDKIVSNPCSSGVCLTSLLLLSRPSHRSGPPAISIQRIFNKHWECR